MNYVLDTNILVFYINDGKTKAFIEETYSPFDLENNAIISFVTVGEIKALALKNKWGKTKQTALDKLISSVVVVELKYEELLEQYAKIDAFSQGKLPINKSKFSARNVGKNDIWIASTTVLVGGELMTSDHDFDHLDNCFFNVIKIKNLD